jgi:hypothetical protein
MVVTRAGDRCEYCQLAQIGWEGPVVVGLTAKARGTIELLKLNRPRILAIRQEEMARGRHPPPA